MGILIELMLRTRAVKLVSLDEIWRCPPHQKAHCWLQDHGLYHWAGPESRTAWSEKQEARSGSAIRQQSGDSSSDRRAMFSQGIQEPWRDSAAGV
jgi:hypothetical protein